MSIGILHVYESSSAWDYIGAVNFNKINTSGNLTVDLMQWLERNIIDRSRGNFRLIFSI